MQACGLLTRPSLGLATDNLLTAFPILRCASRPPLSALGRRQHGSMVSTTPSLIRRFRHAADHPHRVAEAVAAAASTFAQEEDDSHLTALKRRVQQLTTSPYDKEIWAVALPALVAMLLEPVMNAINAGLVGHLGTQQLSAVSLGSLAVSFCTFFYTFLLFLTVPEIAAAVVKEDDEEVSCIVAKSLWIAVVSGIASAATMFAGADAIVAMLKPPEAAVAAFATDYIKIRSLAIPAVLLGFVATAVFRGFKDTRTPLFGALVSATASLGLNVLFLYVLRMGVVGSALATAAAQAVSCCLLLGALFTKGRARGGGGLIQARHLRRPPPLAVMLPTLKLGAVLGARNIISFGMVIYASALSIRMGSTYQASFEVVRQIWLLAIQSFECLNVATQALCATYLGQEDRATARSLLNRLLLLGVLVGAVAGGAVWVMHQPLIAFFTRDPQVVAHVLGALPMICVFFPLDAAAAIMDGSLLAAKQSNFMSAVQIAGSVVQYVVLSYLAATGNVSSLTVWSALKILNVLRVVGGVSRNYSSSRSGYTPIATATPQLLQAVAVAAAAAAEPRRDQLTTAVVAPSPPLPVQAGAVIHLAAAAASPPPTSPDTAAALQSYEDDVMVLACAACTSATEMNPDMLSLKRRQIAAAASGGGGAAVSDGGASVVPIGGDEDRGGNRSRGGSAEGGRSAGPPPPPPPSVPVTAGAASGGASAAAG